MEKIILTTGGTGGHIFPALAVADTIRKRHPNCQILFMGSNYGPEAKLAAKHGLPFRGFQVRGFLGRGIRAIPAAAEMLYAISRAYMEIRRLRPDAIAGFGGYASFAPVLAARFAGIPVLLHEQNAIAGTGNRVLARFAKKICSFLPNTEGLGQNYVVTGNPVRPEIVESARIRGTNGASSNLLILGGSQGAHSINLFIAEHLGEFRRHNINIRHQSGPRDLEYLRSKYQEAGYSPDCVTPFIDNMAEAYNWADLAFCRAGASTLAELSANGLPAVLVPFPAAIHDHQSRNAAIPAGAGAAIALADSEMLRLESVEFVLELLKNPEQLKSMSDAAIKLAKPDAANNITDELEKLLKENNAQ